MSTTVTALLQFLAVSLKQVGATTTAGLDRTLQVTSTPAPAPTDTAAPESITASSSSDAIASATPILRMSAEDMQRKYPALRIVSPSQRAQLTAVVRGDASAAPAPTASTPSPTPASPSPTPSTSGVAGAWESIGPVSVASADGYLNTTAHISSQYLGATNPWNSYSLTAAGKSFVIGVDIRDSPTAGAVDGRIVVAYPAGSVTYGSDILAYPEILYGVGGGSKTGKTPGASLPAALSRVVALASFVESVDVTNVKGLSHCSYDFFLRKPGGTLDDVVPDAWLHTEVMLPIRPTNGYGIPDYPAAAAADRVGQQAGRNPDQWVERTTIGGILFDVFRGKALPATWNGRQSSARLYQPGATVAVGEQYCLWTWYTDQTTGVRSKSYSGQVATITKGGVLGPEDPPSLTWDSPVAQSSGSASYTWEYWNWSNPWQFLVFVPVVFSTNYGIVVNWRAIFDYAIAKGWLSPELILMGIEAGVEPAQNSTTNMSYRMGYNYSTGQQDNCMAIGAGSGQPTRQPMTSTQLGDEGVSATYTITGFRVVASVTA